MTISSKNISMGILLLAITVVIALANEQNDTSDSTAAPNSTTTTTTTTITTSATIITKEDTNENGSLAMVILLSAGSLAFSFFRLVGNVLFSIITTLLLPFYYVLAFCWRNIVTRPFTLLMNIGHALYPVAMFCLAAVCCGTLIGGCAGFAAEAIASFTISTTWGRSANTSSSSLTKQRQQPANYQHPYYDYLNEDEDDTISTATQSEASSQWDPSFFGEQQLGSKGKERIDHWRQTLLPKTGGRESMATTPPASVPKTHSSLASSSSIRYMSPLDYDQHGSTQIPAQLNDDLKDAMDDWAWDEDEDEELDEYSRLRRRSVVR
ncbi:hypothetical protein BDA99DRAFT_495964 [Phascolomyces articulosus]|uniref:Uncharacterized protein n=1 Tax=Phascolomyces articulosus TaxID=60185 RepID=A0AAD5PIZ6_9FUNG|nr:hypothetical protein BDA99DRAFT_495964 [Phascolomyces articulosus]